MVRRNALNLTNLTIYFEIVSQYLFKQGFAISSFPAINHQFRVLFVASVDQMFRDSVSITSPSSVMTMLHRVSGKAFL